MNFRHDIQALRGFAVLIILLFHADIFPFTGGYLGVDVFFVISGFLITSLLVKHIDQADFSFATFYFRRAKRLLPAAYVVLFLATIASLFFMTPSQYRDYKNSLLGALSFTANFALYDQADYFGSDARTKPLLHMWSLSIEEQFYLFLPVLLYFVPRRFWKPMIAGGGLFSLGWYLWRIGDYPEHTFYFLPTRAWELLAGSVAAIFTATPASQRIYNLLFYPALCILITVPVLPVSQTYPGFSTLVMCFATFAVLQKYAAEPMQGRPALPVRALSRLGDYSYSIYLVHWPVFAYANNAVISGNVPLAMRVMLLLLSLLCAAALYHFVEKPIHHGTFLPRRRLVAPLVMASVALVGLCLGIKSVHNSNPRFHEMLTGNLGLNRVCDQTDDFRKLPECETKKNPKILVWGDSYAMHWLPGLASEGQKMGVAQATRRACSPFLNISYIMPPKHNQNWAEHCIGFNRNVLDALRDYPSVNTVVISSIFENVVNPSLDGIHLADNGGIETVPMGPDTAVKAMAETVQKIRAEGKKVVILSPPVKSDFDVGMCLERLKQQKVIFGSEQDCAVSLHQAKEQYADLYSFLARLPKEAGVNVVNLSDYLCEDDKCLTTLHDTILYEDSGHISIPGSIEIARHIKLMDLLIRNAD